MSITFPEHAFRPFFDEPVIVSGSRNGRVRKQSLTLAVMDDMTDDPVSESGIDTEAESIRCVARESDWRYVRDEIVRGDTVVRGDGREYSVTKVGHDSVLGWLFNARRTK